MTDDEMVEWHHQLDGHEFEQAPGVGSGQVSLVIESGAPGDVLVLPSLFSPSVVSASVTL